MTIGPYGENANASSAEQKIFEACSNGNGFEQYVNEIESLLQNIVKTQNSDGTRQAQQKAAEKERLGRAASPGGQQQPQQGSAGLGTMPSSAPNQKSGPAAVADGSDDDVILIDPETARKDLQNSIKAATPAAQTQAQTVMAMSTITNSTQLPQQQPQQAQPQQQQQQSKPVQPAYVNNNRGRDYSTVAEQSLAELTQAKAEKAAAAAASSSSSSFQGQQAPRPSGPNYLQNPHLSSGHMNPHQSTGGSGTRVPQGPAPTHMTIPSNNHHVGPGRPISFHQHQQPPRPTAAAKDAAEKQINQLLMDRGIDVDANRSSASSTPANAPLPSKAANNPSPSQIFLEGKVKQLQAQLDEAVKQNEPLIAQVSHAKNALRVANEKNNELAKERDQWKLLAEGSEPVPTRKAPKQMARNKQLMTINKELSAKVKGLEMYRKETERLISSLRTDNAYLRKQLKLPTVAGSGDATLGSMTLNFRKPRGRPGKAVTTWASGSGPLGLTSSASAAMASGPGSAAASAGTATQPGQFGSGGKYPVSFPPSMFVPSGSGSSATTTSTSAAAVVAAGPSGSGSAPTMTHPSGPSTTLVPPKLSMNGVPSLMNKPSSPPSGASPATQPGSGSESGPVPMTGVISTAPQVPQQIPLPAPIPAPSLAPVTVPATATNGRPESPVPKPLQYPLKLQGIVPRPNGDSPVGTSAPAVAVTSSAPQIVLPAKKIKKLDSSSDED